MKTKLVVTTINVPYVLQRYCEIIKRKNSIVEIIVVADKKTPDESLTFCSHLESEYKVRIKYMSCEKQIEFLKDKQDLVPFLPWNKIQRRNIGILKAYLEGAINIITIDDDNYPLSDEYFKDHLILEDKKKFKTWRSSNNWLNICEFLQDDRGAYFFPRGYPFSKREKSKKVKNKISENGRIVVNAGLWLGDPDVDAITRLSVPLNIIDNSLGNNQVVLSHDTWCPFNSQNTAIHRDVIPAYFLSSSIGRYDDIWSSYVVIKCAQHLGDFIAFGAPIVEHERNIHDLWKDHELEVTGHRSTDVLIGILNKTQLGGRTYSVCTLEIILKIEENISLFELDYHEAILSFCKGYKTWLKFV